MAHRLWPLCLVFGAACKPAEIPEKRTSINENDALEAVFEGSQLLFEELERTARDAGMDLDSDFQGDWPLSGSATLRPGSSVVSTTYVVDRTEMGWPQREWSVELQLEPLIIDEVRINGVLQGHWDYRDYQDSELVEHAFTGELSWQGAGESVDGSGEGTTAFAATLQDGVWILRDGLLGDALIQEGDLGGG